MADMKRKRLPLLFITLTNNPATKCVATWCQQPVTSTHNHPLTRVNKITFHETKKRWREFITESSDVII